MKWSFHSSKAKATTQISKKELEYSTFFYSQPGPRFFLLYLYSMHRMIYKYIIRLTKFLFPSFIVVQIIYNSGKMQTKIDLCYIPVLKFMDSYNGKPLSRHNQKKAAFFRILFCTCIYQYSTERYTVLQGLCFCWIESLKKI